MSLFLFKTTSVRQTEVSFPIPASQDWQGLGAWREGLAVCGGGRERGNADGGVEAGGGGAGAPSQVLRWGCQARSGVCWLPRTDPGFWGVTPCKTYKEELKSS